MRIACILAPHLPVQVEKNRDPGLTGRPVIVGGQPWDPGVVLDCCPAGEADGIHPGMRLARAEVLCPTARFLPADEPAYRAVHQALEATIRRFTDRIETAGPGLFFADVTGLERTFDSDSHLARRLALEVGAALGHFPGPSSAVKPDVRLGMASDRFTAEQAAHAARPPTGLGEASARWCLVPPGEERSFLSPLPLPTLPIDPEPLRRLNLLGVRTLGALAALPRLALSRQFGPQAGFLHDLASGRDPRPVYADAPPLVLEGRHAFEPPVAGRGPLTAQAGRTVSALAADLSRRGYHAEGLKVRLEDEVGDIHIAAASVDPPTAGLDRLTRKAGELLERLSPPRPVAALTITLYPLRPAHLGATQLTLFTGPVDARRARLQETLRRLRERFGEMVIVVASLLGPPPPRPIQVTTDPEGLPCALVQSDCILPVTQVYEHWRERRRWWTHPLLRDYYRTETTDGRVRVVFHDLEGGQWWMERRRL
jgi:DNA polymerase-4